MEREEPLGKTEPAGLVSFTLLPMRDLLGIGRHVRRQVLVEVGLEYATCDMFGNYLSEAVFARGPWKMR